MQDQPEVARVLAGRRVDDVAADGLGRAFDGRVHREPGDLDGVVAAEQHAVEVEPAVREPGGVSDRERLGDLERDPGGRRGSSGPWLSTVSRLCPSNHSRIT